MPLENKNTKSKIKYSIWETRTDKSQLASLEDLPELGKKLNSEADRKDS